MSVATRSYLQIAEEVARNLGGYQSGTLTAATNTALTSAVYPFKTNRSNASTARYAAAQIYITSGTAPDVNPNEISAYAPSTGVFTPGVSYTTPPASNATFDIYGRGFDIAEIKQAINRALRKLRYVSIVPLSLLPDADFSSSSATDDWGTAVTATVSKVSTTTPGLVLPNFVRNTRAMRVLCTSANGYQPTKILVVTPGDTYFCQITAVRAAVGTAKLIAWDNTNSAEIASETWANEGWGRINFTFTVPSTCERITLRLSGVGASDDTYWSGDLFLLRQGSHEVPLPDYLDDEADLRRVLYSIETDEYDADIMREHYWWDISPNEGSTTNPFKVRLYPSARDALWLEVSRPFPALSADADTTFANREWIEAAATVEYLRLRINKEPGEDTKAWRAELSNWERQLRAYNSRFMPRPMLRRQFASPSPV